MRTASASKSKNYKGDLHENNNKLLNQQSIKDDPLTFSHTINSAGYLQSAKVALLPEQKRVLEKIAAQDRDCVIAGRNADVILKDRPDPRGYNGAPII